MPDATRKRVTRRKTLNADGEVVEIETIQWDYLEPGSSGHANFLGIRKLQKGETAEISDRGYTFIDVRRIQTPLMTRSYLELELRSRVDELLSKPEVPSCSPAMWRP